MAEVHKAFPGEAGPGDGDGGGAAQTTGATVNPGRDWKRTFILGGAALVVLIIAYFILGAFIPRWWSQQIGRAVNGSFTVGTLLGLCLGFTFTIVPLAVLTLAVRPRLSWKLRVSWLVLALLVAFPNLCTLGVVLGSGSGAHAGQRTLDVQAPSFRGATLIGALIAAIVYFVVLFLILRRVPRGKAGQRQVTQSAQSAQPPQPPAPSG